MLCLGYQSFRGNLPGPVHAGFKPYIFHNRCPVLLKNSTRQYRSNNEINAEADGYRARQRWEATCPGGLISEGAKISLKAHDLPKIIFLVLSA